MFEIDKRKSCEINLPKVSSPLPATEEFIAKNAVGFDPFAQQWTEKPVSRLDRHAAFLQAEAYWKKEKHERIAELQHQKELCEEALKINEIFGGDYGQA